MKQNIVHCPSKSFLPSRNNGVHKGIHRIIPLPPGNEWRAAVYLETNNLYVAPPTFKPPNAPLPFPHILIVGMAPGESEDLHGEPFIGRSGNILNTMLAYSYSTFLMTCTNTVCCRPFHKKGITADEFLWGKNRDPEPAEMEHCKDHITQILLSYKFTGVLTLGEVATKHMKSFKHGLPSLSLYHPAYIARLGFKLYTIKDEAQKLKQWLRELNVRLKNNLNNSFSNTAGNGKRS